MSDLNPDSTPLSRVDLLQLAQSLGVSDADVMTRAELRAAIDKARRPDPVVAEQHSTTWVSVARRLLASVVERGLNLPDAAALIRGDTKLNAPPKAPPPVATVTLARIYAAQGHLDRAIATLKEVLESDPDHDLASELRTQLELRRAETLARANAARAPVAEDPGVTADAPPASTAADSLDPAALAQNVAPSPAVLAALVSELAATAPEADAPAMPAPPFGQAAALASEMGRAEAGRAETGRSETEPAPLAEWPGTSAAAAPNGVATEAPHVDDGLAAEPTAADATSAPPSGPSPPARLDQAPNGVAAEGVRDVAGEVVANGLERDADGEDAGVRGAAAADSAFAPMGGADAGAGRNAAGDAVAGSSGADAGGADSAFAHAALTDAGAGAADSAFAHAALVDAGAGAADSAFAHAALVDAGRNAAADSADWAAAGADAGRNAAGDAAGAHAGARPYIVGGESELRDAAAPSASPEEAAGGPSSGDLLPPPYIASDIAPSTHAALDRDGTAPTPPPGALRVDPSAELVAPAFGAVASDASGAEFSPAFQTEAPTLDGALSNRSELAAPPSLLPDTDTEPAPTIATGIDAPLAPEQTQPTGAPAPMAPLGSDEPAPARGAPAGLASTPLAPPADAPSVQAPNGIVNGVSLGKDSAPSAVPLAPPPPRPTPETPGLLLIETDTSIHYVYWELSAPDPSRPHWIHVVTHSPTPDGGAERRERRFPVHRPHGALRLEGLPPHSIVRAKLTRTPNDPKPLVVASSVRPRALPGTETYEIRYTPHTQAKPEALARRAKPLLEQASAVYWD